MPPRRDARAEVLMKTPVHLKYLARTPREPEMKGMTNFANALEFPQWSLQVPQWPPQVPRAARSPLQDWPPRNAMFPAGGPGRNVAHPTFASRHDHVPPNQKVTRRQHNGPNSGLRRRPTIMKFGPVLTGV